MDIIYQSDTLYVFLKEPITKGLIDSLKYKISYIVREYTIPNIVLKLEKSVDTEYFEKFIDEFNIKVNEMVTHE